jgi:hypothetical protein
MFFTLSIVDLEEAESSSQDSSSNEEEEDNKEDNAIVKEEPKAKASESSKKRSVAKGSREATTQRAKKRKTTPSGKGSAVASKKGNTHILLGVKPCDDDDGFDEIARADVTDKDALQHLFKKVNETPDGEIHIPADWAQPNLNSQQDLSTTIE